MIILFCDNISIQFATHEITMSYRVLPLSCVTVKLLDAAAAASAVIKGAATDPPPSTIVKRDAWLTQPKVFLFTM